jgi:hypothetical protein
LPPPRFELQIFRLPGKGGYSARPLGTTRSLIIWIEVYVASVTIMRYLAVFRTFQTSVVDFKVVWNCAYVGFYLKLKYKRASRPKTRPNKLPAVIVGPLKKVKKCKKLSHLGVNWMRKHGRDVRYNFYGMRDN